VKPRPANQPGPHRPAPPCPPIDPALTYPIRRLGDWSFGARTVAKMQKEGLRVLKYSKWKFVRGADLIAFLEGQPDTTSGAVSANSPGKTPDARTDAASDAANGGNGGPEA